MSERRARKRSAALRAVESLWPHGVPDDIRPFEMAKQIRLWLSDYCRGEGYPELSITYATIKDAIDRSSLPPIRHPDLSGL
jgi:hypothetical protein